MLVVVVMNYDSQRESMVSRQLAARGISDVRVLAAMRGVPRQAFVPEEQAEFAYADTPLPIEEGQTISQPYVVAWMAQALELLPGDRVLEIGTGSGYAAAVLSKLAAQVDTIERHASLARSAQARLAQEGFTNVAVRCGDGTLGWPERAPYDAIVIAAGGPSVPPPLLAQLKVGGRLVMPVGSEERVQKLVRVTRTSESETRTEQLGEVQFVPLIGAAGWPIEVNGRAHRSPRGSPGALSRLIAEEAEPLDGIESAQLGPLLERIGEARVVLLGEATHGTSEFYRMRARITRELILRRGFRRLAIEADWPDAARVDRYVRHHAPASEAARAFHRFPTWMWRNAEFAELLEWLREYNREARNGDEQIRVHGLDLYSLSASAAAVIDYLEPRDAEAARLARARYGCLTPWQTNPEAYGRAALRRSYRSCEEDVVSMLRELLARRVELIERDGEQFFDAVQNARLVANAERYYRAMYGRARESWNLRDQHMFDTLQQLRGHGDKAGKIVVWEHNSHVGDASATEMAAQGEHNVGQLCRQAFPDELFIAGFGTDRGEVTAADDWDSPPRTMQVRPSRPESYERLFHDTGFAALLLPLRHPRREALREELSGPRLERAIGVVYRPERELQSHYFQARLPEQFDEYIWFDETRAVSPQPTSTSPGVPETFPFGV